MGYLLFFIWLAVQAPFVGLLMPPEYSILALSGLVVALVAASANPAPLRSRWKWLLSPFLISALILAFDVVFKFPGKQSEVPDWGITGLYALLWLHLPITLGLIAYCWRNPMVPLGLAAFQTWYSLCALAMSGEWL